MKVAGGYSEEWWLQYLIRIIEERFHTEIELSACMLLSNCLVDSLDSVELIMAIEDEFRMEVDYGLETVQTIGDLARVLARASRGETP